jgi:hypothetical protein
MGRHKKAGRPSKRNNYQRLRYQEKKLESALNV